MRSTGSTDGGLTTTIGRGRGEPDPVHRPVVGGH